jgi:hypothetical protein
MMPTNLAPSTSNPPLGPLTLYQQQAQQKISEAFQEVSHAFPDLSVPTVLCHVIAEHTGDLAEQPLIIDAAGHSLNPEVRQAIKAALVTDDCPHQIKSRIFNML